MDGADYGSPTSGFCVNTAEPYRSRNDQMDTDYKRNRHVLFNGKVELSDKDDKTTYERLCDDSSTTVRAEKSIESAELSNFSKGDQTASAREQEKDEIDIGRDEREVGEKIAPVNLV